MVRAVIVANTPFWCHMLCTLALPTLFPIPRSLFVATGVVAIVDAGLKLIGTVIWLIWMPIHPELRELIIWVAVILLTCDFVALLPLSYFCLR